MQRLRLCHSPVEVGSESRVLRSIFPYCQVRMYTTCSISRSQLGSILQFSMSAYCTFSVISRYRQYLTRCYCQCIHSGALLDDLCCEAQLGLRKLFSRHDCALRNTNDHNWVLQAYINISLHSPFSWVLTLSLNGLQILCGLAWIERTDQVSGRTICDSDSDDACCYMQD